MKQLTIKQLNTMINVPEATIRAWIMKPIDGVPYSRKNINYTNLQTKLKKYFEDFEAKFGFKVEDIEIVVGEKTKKVYTKVEDLVEGDDIVLHNYSLQSELTLLQKIIIEDEVVYLFRGEKGLKAYYAQELEKSNIKIEKVEE